MEGKKKCVSLQPVSEKEGVFLQRNGKFIDNNEREKRGKEAETRSRVVGLKRAVMSLEATDCGLQFQGNNTHESVIHEEKEIRADGGCLGFRRR